MYNIFTSTEVVELGMNGGVLLIEGINSLRIFAVNCKANDWLTFNGYRDPNLINLLDLQDNEVQAYADKCANGIMTSERLSESQKKIYSNLYTHYYSIVRRNILMMSKDYTYIRVYFSEMDDYNEQDSESINDGSKKNRRTQFIYV